MAEVATVVGWLVSPIIKLLIDDTKSYASSQYKWLTGTPAELKRLAAALTQLQATAGAIERQRIKDDKQLAWLCDLKDAICEIEDVLDEFGYQILECSIDKDKKAAARLLSSSLQFSRRLIGTDDSLHRLKAVHGKLDGIVSRSGSFIRVVDLDASGSIQRTDQDASFRITSSFPTEDKVFGRDKERAEIVGRLISFADGPQPGDQSVPVVAVVGDGGMGKTTLAQLVYNDQRVEEHFKLRMWICVGKVFDEMKLTKEILEHAAGETDISTTNLNVLQKNLKAAVTSQKFLLVLDDVWYDETKNEWENEDRWRKLLAPLQFGEKGSRVLATTRTKVVASMFGAWRPIILEGIGRDEYWLLFKKCAMGDENTDAFPELQEIGKQIAAKLKSSPLAAKAVGGMLRNSRSTTKWKDVLDREIYDNIVSVLMSSYLHLPDHLQVCFSYCSLFPKKWRFEPKKLVKMWIAQGFIQPGNRTEKRMEDIGSEFFNHLVSRSFFQTLKQGYKTYYIIHDLMHDLAQSVSINECIRIEGDKPRKIPPTVRHLSVTSHNLSQLKNQCELSKLRSLVIIKSPAAFSVDYIQDDLLKELRSIRALDLTGCNVTDLPEAIGQLIHLRYLALCDTLKRLPESLSKLLHLQALIIPKRCKLDKFPEGMDKLMSLRHLDIDSKYIAKIVGIGRLVNLQGSVEFHVKGDRKQSLEELKDMNDLHGQLDIKNLENVINKEEACKAELTNKQYVKVLKLEWNSNCRHPQPVVDAEVLEGLKPHLNINELHITRYRGASSPSWLESTWLSHLKSLYLTNCRRWEKLPPLGQLPVLKVLHLKEMSLVERIGHEFYGSNNVGFPCLKDLQFDDLPRCFEWLEKLNGNCFPRLQKLKLSNCPKLIKVPSIPRTVINMTIERAGLVSHLKLSHFMYSSPISFTLDTCSTTVLSGGLLQQEHLRAIQVLNIRSCEDPMVAEHLQVLISLRRLQIFQCFIDGKHLHGFLQGLKSLSTLDFAECHNITSLPLPEEVNHHLTALQELRIRGCRLLNSLTALQFLTSLKSLTIERCPELTAASFPADLKNLSSLIKFSISYCPKLMSLPENGLPSSLESLHLIGCHPELMEQLRKKKGAEWDKIMAIPNVIVR